MSHRSSNASKALAVSPRSLFIGLLSLMALVSFGCTPSSTSSGTSSGGAPSGGGGSGTNSGTNSGSNSGGGATTNLRTDISGLCTSSGATTSNFSCTQAGLLLQRQNPPTVAGDSSIEIPITGLIFPMQNGPAYANSQANRFKNNNSDPFDPNWIGADSSPLGNANTGSWQCDTRNYSYPWQDTFCESRGNFNDPSSYGCSNSAHHEGIDIRPGSCSNRADTVVAVADGEIIVVANHYTKQINTSEDAWYSYFHMIDRNHSTLMNSASPRIAISQGDPLGMVSNIGRHGTPATTYHLHFEIRMNVTLPDGSIETVVVSPYATMADAYDRLVNP